MPAAVLSRLFWNWIGFEASALGYAIHFLNGWKERNKRLLIPGTCHKSCYKHSNLLSHHLFLPVHSKLMFSRLFSLQKVSLIERLLSGKSIGTRDSDNTLKRGGIIWKRVELAYGLLVQAVSFAEWKILGQVLSKCRHFFSFWGGSF